MSIVYRMLCGIVTLALLSVVAQAEPKQGGQMTITYKDDISTLDPQIGYDWQNWSMIKSLFDGLMDYKPGTTELIPDLAESYEVSADGLAYTFKLRKGVKFHNGRELTSADIKYSIERAVNPATQSPGQGFFWQIKGYDDMVSGALHRNFRASLLPIRTRSILSCHNQMRRSCRS